MDSNVCCSLGRNSFETVSHLFAKMPTCKMYLVRNQNTPEVERLADKFPCPLDASEIEELSSTMHAC